MLHVIYQNQDGVHLKQTQSKDNLRKEQNVFCIFIIRFKIIVTYVFIETNTKDQTLFSLTPIHETKFSVHRH